MVTDPTDDSVPSAAQGIGDALADEDEELGSPDDEPTPILDLRLPAVTRRSSRAHGRASASGAVVGSTYDTGRTGGGSRRRVARAAQRGALAIGAAYALKRGDEATLRELGLDLGELRNMSVRQQRLTLLDAILGDAGHPDEVALRQAADEFLKSVLTDAPPTALDALRRYVGSLIYRVGMIELKGQRLSEQVDAQRCADAEVMLKDWIEQRLGREDFGIRGEIVELSQFQRVAIRLVKAGITILKASVSR